MARPRLLLVPRFTELEWRIAPMLEEWADIASFDAPGVAAEPWPESSEAEPIVARGLAEIDRRGWDRCILVSDEFANAIAVRMAAARPDAVQALALGHASLSLSDRGADAPVSADVIAGFNTLLETDYRAWVRAYTQLTQGAYDDETMNRFLERVPEDVSRRHSRLLDVVREDLDIEAELRRLDVPLLFAEHRDCLVFRAEGYRAAKEAFPEAVTVSTLEKPSCSPDFARALRAFAMQVREAAPA